jgi:hypothetical protein
MRAVQVPQNGVVEGLCPNADSGEADLPEFAQARRRRMQWKDFDGTLACDRDLFKHVREVARVERGCPTAHVQGCEWSGVVHLDLCVQRSEVVRRQVIAGQHLVVRAEGADPLAEGDMNVSAWRAVERGHHLRRSQYRSLRTGHNSSVSPAAPIKGRGVTSGTSWWRCARCVRHPSPPRHRTSTSSSSMTSHGRWCLSCASPRRSCCRWSSGTPGTG